MNITQFAVLRAVQRHVHEPLSRVAEDLAMDRSSLYRALGGLEKQHWVTVQNGSDGRMRTARVSAAGEAALARADAGWSSTQRALIERFGPARWQALAAELQRLSDCARELEPSE